MSTNNFNVQSSFENDYLIIQPLVENDFDRLFEIGGVQKLWEQHPNPDRYKKEVFKTYFDGAILSNSAFIILDKQTNEVVGCTRFYEINHIEKNVFIGYTFVGVNYWGKEHNRDVKKILVNYALNFFESVRFHIGAENIRSQKAVAKLGAIKIGEENMSYYGELPKLNFIYELNNDNWNF